MGQMVAMAVGKRMVNARPDPASARKPLLDLGSAVIGHRVRSLSQIGAELAIVVNPSAIRDDVSPAIRRVASPSPQGFYCRRRLISCTDGRRYYLVRSRLVRYAST